MTTLAGAFGNLHNFLHFIALNNCMDLFHQEQAEKEEVEAKGELADLTRRKYSRLLFNAVVSLDSALDHAFAAEGGGNDKALQAFNKRLFKKEPALRDLREVSNALKHCVTSNPKKIDGADVVQTRIEGEVGLAEGPSVQVKVEVLADVIDKASDALPKAFRFWMAQAQKMDARNPRIDLTIETPKPEPELPKKK